MKDILIVILCITVLIFLYETHKRDEIIQDLISICDETIIAYKELWDEFQVNTKEYLKKRRTK